MNDQAPTDAAQIFSELKQVIARLRSPDGCPWDREQNFTSMKPQFLEEVYEFIDALEENQSQDMAEELGDLFFHLLFFVQMGEDENRFALNTVLERIRDKLIRRHPHVFGAGRSEGETAIDSEAVKQQWDKIKREVEGKHYQSLLDGIPASLPPLAKAVLFGRRAAKVGFDWARPEDILPKIREELAEVEAELPGQGRPLDEELGDLLFVVVNLVRLCGRDPDRVLRLANDKFDRRFRFMEAAARRQGRGLAEMSLAEQEELWQQSKN